MKRRIRYASHDFSDADLPRTRRAEFVFLWRNRRRTMAALSGLAFLGMLPLLVVLSLRMFNLAALEDSWAAEKVAASTIAMERSRFLLTYHLLDVPCFAFLFLVFSAILHIERQMSLNQPVFFWADAWQGIKNDGLIFAFTGLLFGLARFGCAYGNEMQTLPWFVRVLPYAIVVDFFLPACLFFLTLRVTYRISWKELFKGSFALFFHHAAITLLFAWSLVLWEFATLIPFFSVRLLAFLLEAVLFLPSWSLGWMLFSFSCFDQDINPISSPADTYRGLAAASNETPRR